MCAKSSRLSGVTSERLAVGLTRFVPRKEADDCSDSEEHDPLLSGRSGAELVTRSLRATATVGINEDAARRWAVADAHLSCAGFDAKSEHDVTR